MRKFWIGLFCVALVVVGLLSMESPAAAEDPPEGYDEEVEPDDVSPPLEDIDANWGTSLGEDQFAQTFGFVDMADLLDSQ